MKRSKARASSAPAKERPAKAKRATNDESPASESVLATDLSEKAIEKGRNAFAAAKPFAHHVIESVFSDKFLESVRKELETKAEWNLMSNDLYTFEQSDDLKKTKLPNLAKMRDAIYSPEFRAFIYGVTGIELGEQVDASAARYSKGSTLLCHDDELEGRRVAYIFYLVPRDWKAADGGALDLYDADEAGEARSVVKSIVPKWNSCAFFAVTNKSWHRVAEVLRDSDARMSISGWFHGVPLPRPPPARDVLPPLQALDAAKTLDLSEWLNPVYLKPDTVKQIKRHFISNDSVQLQDFLLPKRYAALVAALASASVAWKRVGPANRRQYDSVNQATAPKGALRSTIELFLSPVWAAFLASLSNIKVEQARIEARRFVADTYTLTEDGVELASQTVLDVALSVAPPDWPEEVGGTTTYLTPEGELLSTAPQPNALTLAYRSGSEEVPVMRFTKYVSHTAPEAIYDISAMYWEEKEEKETKTKAPAKAKSRGAYGAASAVPAAAETEKSKSRSKKQRK